MRNTRMRALVAVLAVVLAILGIASLVVWTNGARTRAFSGTETVTVWQVTKGVSAGTAADALGGSVEKVTLPKASVPSTAVGSLAEIRGKIATASLVPGEVLVSGRFGSEKDLQEVPLPKGLQEVTIELAATRVIGGVLKGGEHVGVLASYTGPPNQTNFAANHALVLAVTSMVGNGEGAAQPDPGGNLQVRLALSSIEVEKVVHASEFGKVWLSRQGKGAKIDRQLIETEDVLK
jgi:pilus assembly protein CpaB